MATFAHFAAGAAAGRLPGRDGARPRLVQAAFGLLAMAPDLDSFIPGLRHDGPTGRSHTPVVTLIVSAAVAMLGARVGLAPRASFLAALVGIGSQPLFDALTHGKGEAIAWPLSSKRYFRRVPGLPTWKPELGVSRRGLRSLGGELAWSLPLFAIAAFPVPRRPRRERLSAPVTGSEPERDSLERLQHQPVQGHRA